MALAAATDCAAYTLPRSPQMPTAVPSPTTPPPPSTEPPRWQRGVLAIGVLLGLLAVLAGVLQFELYARWDALRAGETGLILLALAAFGIGLARLSGQRFATALLVGFAFYSVVVVGLAAALAALLVLVTAAAIALRLFGEASRLPGEVRLLVGLGVIAAAIGWTLPLPIHHRFSYLAAALLLIVPQRQALWRQTQAALGEWQAKIAPHPALAGVVCLSVLGIASHAWLPTMLFDDLGYHLALPSQLHELGYYRMDAATQVWAFAPWLGDCIFAAAHVLAGADARGPVNLIWLGIAAAGLFRLTHRLWPGDQRASWLAVALYLTLPINAVLVAGMQTELFSTALLLAAFNVLLAGWRDREPREHVLGFAVVVGSLLMTKTSMVPFALLLTVGFVLSRYRHGDRRALARLLPIALLIGGSAYFYAFAFTGNPILPLANSLFHSHYFPLHNFANSKYTLPLDLPHLWAMLFDTGRFYLGHGGNSGFHWLPLLVPALLACRASRTLGVVALTGVLIAAGIYSAQSYLRYLLPALALTIPAFAAGASLLGPRLGTTLCGVLVAGNLAFLTNVMWILGTGATFAVFAQPSQAEAIRSGLIPELRLIELARLQDPNARILATSVERPFTALSAGTAFTTSWYDTELNQLRAAGGADRFGQLLRRYAFTHAVHYPRDSDDGAETALREVGAELIQRNGRASLWRLPPPRPAQIDLYRSRDLSLRSSLAKAREQYRVWHRGRKLRHPERYRDEIDD